MKKNLFFLVSLLLFTACSVMKKETLQEIAEHTEVSYVLSDEQRDIVSASNDFGLLLFKQLVKTNPDSSLILSPMGVVYNLNMLNNGAGGTTLQEICKVLGYKPTDLSRVNALNRLLLIGQRKQMKRSDREVKGYMQTSNLLAINKQFPINEAFKDSLSHYYFADVLAASVEYGADGGEDNRAAGTVVKRHKGLSSQHRCVCWLMGTIFLERRNTCLSFSFG